jgi:hypothetical protein
MRDLIQEELDEVIEEQDRAEGSDLIKLQGWQEALQWVIKRLPEEG